MGEGRVLPRVFCFLFGTWINLPHQQTLKEIRKLHFDTVANQMHDIWKGLAPSPIRALFTRSNEIHRYNTRHATKENYLRKEVKLKNFKRSLFRELERHYGITLA